MFIIKLKLEKNILYKINMPGLSDAELKKRLEAHNITVPPITVTTRALLQKKLDKLDYERQKSSTGLYI